MYTACMQRNYTQLTCMYRLQLIVFPRGDYLVKFKLFFSVTNTSPFWESTWFNGFDSISCVPCMHISILILPRIVCPHNYIYIHKHIYPLHSILYMKTHIVYHIYIYISIRSISLHHDAARIMPSSEFLVAVAISWAGWLPLFFFCHNNGGLTEIFRDGCGSKMEDLGDHRWKMSTLVLTIQLLGYLILTHTQIERDNVG